MASRNANRLSPLDAAFLYLEKPNQRLHVGCVALIDGTIPFDAFAGAMGERLGAIERYRQRPVRPLLDLDWPRWEEDDEFDMRHHLRHVAVPAPGGERELHELVDTLFAMPFDRRHPLWETYLIDGLAGGRSALLCKVHHSMIDGVSGAQVLAAMADGYVGAATDATSTNAARAVPAWRGVGTALRAALRPSTVLARAKEAAEMATTIVAMVRQPSSEVPFNGPLTDARHLVWTSFALEDFLALRGAAGCKVNDVVLTVIAGALRRYLLARGITPDALRVRTLVPVSVRPADARMTLGNLVSSMFPTLPVGVADPIARLRAMAEEMRTLKERGQAQASGMLMALAGSLPAALSAGLARLLPDRSVLNTVCTNVPGPRDTCTLLGRPIVEVYPLVPLFQNMGLEFAIMSYAGRLSICAAAEPHLVPDADTLADHLQAAAAELADALRACAPPVQRPAPGVSVADLMTADPITIGPEDTLRYAYGLMRSRSVRHLPVIGADARLMGIVTHRDLLAASSSSLNARSENERVGLLDWASAADIMETHVSVAAPDEPAATAGERMVRYKIGCQPVVDARGKLVGIVTEEDYLRWATACMSAPGAPARATA
jgi:WS/DGAT/MGAT family acyltransferase